MVRTLQWEKAWALVAALTLLMAVVPAGCSKKSSSMSVVSTAPAANSTGNSPDAKVTVKFSAPLKEASITPATFVVSGSQSGVLAGSLNYNDAARMVTFSPSGVYQEGEMVTVSLSSTIQGKSGANLASRRYKFAIRPAVVPPPPPPPPPPPADAAVKGRVPAPYATGVAVDSTIYVEFTERMDPLTFTQDTLRMSGDLGGRIDVQIGDVSLVGNRVSILPRRPFLAGEWITVSLGSSLRTAAGARFPGDSFAFRAVTRPPVRSRLPGPTFSTGGPIQLFRLADFDRDGFLDLVYVLTGESKVKIARTNGAAGFQAALDLEAGRTIISLAVADLNDDGRMDIIVGATDRAVLFRGQGTGVSFAGAETYATGTSVRGIAVGNIDRTGLPDVLLNTDRGLRLYRNGLGGTPALTIGQVQVSRTDLGLSDLDLDGALDLLYGDTTGDRLGYHRAGGDSFLLPEEAIALGGDALWLRVEDLNRDGKPEIVVHSASATEASLEIHTFTAASGGAAPTLQPMPLESGRSFELADFMGNGVASLIVADPEAAKVLLFAYHDGQFDLDSPVVLAGGFPPSGVRAGDLTGDGVLDLVISSNGDFHTILSEGVDDPPDGDASLSVDSIEAHAGDAGKKTLIRLSSAVAVEGFAIALTFDPLAVASPTLELAGTASAALTPEFVSPVVHAPEGYATLAVIFDMLPPFDGRTLAPGDDVAIAAFKFSVPADAPEGATSIALENGLGAPPVSNSVSSAGASIAPQLAAGTLTVLPSDPPGDAGLTVSSVDALKGDTGKSATVRLSSGEAVEAFTIVLAFDPRAVAAPTFDLAGTASAALTPEFVSPGIHAAEGYASLAVAFDLMPPFDGRSLAPGADVVIAAFKFNVPADAPEGDTALELKDGLGTPPIANTVSSGGLSIAPRLTAGTLTVRSSTPAPQARLSIDSLVAAGGDTDKKAVIHLNSNVGVDAFVVVLAFDPRAIIVTGFDLLDTASATLHPEFVSPGIHAGEGFASLGVSFDLLPPFDGRILAPGDNIAIANFKFNVPLDAPGGNYPLEFKNGLGEPPTNNYVHSSGKSITPTVVAGAVTVNSLPNPNKLRIQSVHASPGSTGNRATVFLTCVEDIDAFTVIGAYDPAKVVLKKIDTVGTVTGPLNPEFVIPAIRPDDKYFSYTAIFDFSPPFDRQHISPGNDQVMLILVFDVPASASKGESRLDLRNSIGIPPLSNSLVTTGAMSVFPDLLPGGVVTIDDQAPQFIRGDVNRTRKLDLADHIFLLNYLFYHGAEPPCLDAADLDDNGRVNMVDSVNLVDFIFKGQPVPPKPYPAAGTDPTPDELGCTQGL